MRTIHRSLFETLADLVGINSVNPSFQGGIAEKEIASYVQRFFVERGIEAWEEEVFPGRSNVIARLPGRDPSRRILLEAHMDTVGVSNMNIAPFEPRIEGGIMFGRGTSDTKGGLAAMMHAVAAIKKEGVQPPWEVWLAAVVDEEYSFGGATKLCQNLSADLALVAEPTGLQPVIASKGVLRWRIVVRGKSAHSGKPHLGVNAIARMASVLTKLQADEQRLGAKIHPLLGSPTCNIGLIYGGTQVNSVPDTCTIEIDRRTVPGEVEEQVLGHYQSLLDELRAQEPTLDVSMQAPTYRDQPYEVSEDSTAAKMVAHVLREMHLKSDFCGVPFNSDANKIGHRGIPSIVIGPGRLEQAHSATEFVDLEEVRQASEFYRRCLLGVPGNRLPSRPHPDDK